VQRLGRDVVGEPVRDLRALRPGQRAVGRAVDAYDAEGAVTHVRDAGAVGARARGDDRARGGDPARDALVRAHGPQGAREGEHDQADGRVGGVRDDARARLARPLAADPLGLRDLSAVAERERVGEQPLLAVLVQPQQARRGAAARGAQEDDAVAVRRDGEAARHTEGEAFRTGVLQGQVFGGHR
jgi:hypothetical protein